MDFKGKKLLILGGAGVHCKVVEAAKEMGVYTIVTDYLTGSPAKLMADESIMLSILDVDAIVDYCRSHGVDGVLNFCNDPAQKPHQQICEKLGLPCFGNAEQVLALSNKQSFKKMCIDNGVDVIPTYSEEDAENGAVEYPVIVKPVDSRGSRGLALCRSMDELLPALEAARKESSNGKAIIEKYMGDKQDFTMTYIFADGKANLIRTGDRYLGDPADGLDKQCIGTVAPSRNSEMFIEKVNQRVIKMLQNLGIKNSPVFMQGFIDGDTVRFYDPGIRFPGGDYEKLLYKATGMNAMKLIIAYALGGKIDTYDGKLGEGYKLNGMRSVQLTISSRPGKIALFEGLDEIRKLPEVVTVAQKAEVGDEIPASGDVKQRIAEVVILVKNDAAVVKDAIKKVQALLKVQDENGENMLVSQFDPNNI